MATFCYRDHGGTDRSRTAVDWRFRSDMFENESRGKVEIFSLLLFLDLVGMHRNLNSNRRHDQNRTAERIDTNRVPNQASSTSVWEDYRLFGRLLSSQRSRPTGSNWAGVPVASRARRVTSFRVMWRTIRSALYRQERIKIDYSMGNKSMQSIVLIGKIRQCVFAAIQLILLRYPYTIDHYIEK